MPCLTSQFDLGRSPTHVSCCRPWKRTNKFAKSLITRPLIVRFLAQIWHRAWSRDRLMYYKHSSPRGQRSRSQRENVASLIAKLLLFLWNRGHWIEWRCQNFDQKLENICAHVQYKFGQNSPKRLRDVGRPRVAMHSLSPFLVLLLLGLPKLKRLLHFNCLIMSYLVLHVWSRFRWQSSCVFYSGYFQFGCRYQCKWQPGNVSNGTVRSARLL